MAELAKKLHFLKSGIEQTAKAYSTTDEVGADYIPSKIDSTDCYISIVDTKDGRATNGRIIKSGTEYAIATTAFIPYKKLNIQLQELIPLLFLLVLLL